MQLSVRTMVASVADVFLTFPETSKFCPAAFVFIRDKIFDADFGGARGYGRLCRPSYGWSDKGATKIARIILKRFTNAKAWKDYCQNKMNCIGNVVINIGNYKCFFTKFRTITNIYTCPYWNSSGIFSALREIQRSGGMPFCWRRRFTTCKSRGSRVIFFAREVAEHASTTAQGLWSPPFSASRSSSLAAHSG